MTPLQTFAQTVTEARKVFDADRNMTAWLVFYEAKQGAYAKLVVALPQVKAIEDFWRYVQSMPRAQWLRVLAREIKRIRASWVCQDCRVPMEKAGTCPKCLKTRRLESLRVYRERQREITRSVRGCPDCGTKLGMRQRFCQPCATSRRRESKRRSKRRQLTRKSPSEKMKQFSIPVQEADPGSVFQLSVPKNPMKTAGTV